MIKPDEICLTNYPHPTIHHGQHTNGPAAVWIRVGCDWHFTGSHSFSKVRKELDEHGADRILSGEWKDGLAVHS